MHYSKSVLLYRDKPRYGLVLKLILLIPAVPLAGGLYLWLCSNNTDGLALLIESFIIGLIFWLVFPREYQIFEDRIRIVLGGSLSVKIGFQNVKVIRTTGRTGLTVNFVTRITRRYVEIVIKRGLGIVITPTDNENFIENANRALEQWKKQNSKPDFISS
ncbi:MAG: hypothetical protein PHU23_14500 [Dehalococcoidales bacterium]|nr:hypothetical protein [Dehalococcoidales bacterium]